MAEKKPVPGSVAEIDKELEELDNVRLAAKARGQILNKAKEKLLLKEEVIARFLNGAPFSHRQVKWMEENKADWEKIKKDYEGKQGSRKVQTVGVQGMAPAKKPKG